MIHTAFFTLFAFAAVVLQKVTRGGLGYCWACALLFLAAGYSVAVLPDLNWKLLIAANALPGVFLWATARRPQAGSAKWLAAFFVVLVVSSLVGTSPTASLPRLYGIGCVVVIATACCSITSIRSVSLPMTSANLFLTTATLIGVFCLYIFLTGSGGGGSRWSLKDSLAATQTAALLVLGVAGFAGFAISGRRTLKYVSLCCWFVIQYMVFLTGTRGAIAACMFIAPIVIVPRFFSDKTAGRLLLLSCGIGLLLFSHAAVLEVVSGSDNLKLKKFLRLDRGDVLDTRRELWEDAFAKGWERPLLGRGIGMSTYHHAEDRLIRGLSEDEIRRLVGKRTVHSQFVENFYETGLVGSALFLALVTVSCRGAAVWLNFGLNYNRPEATALSLGMLATVLGFVSHGGVLAPGNPFSILNWLLIISVTIDPRSLYEVENGLNAVDEYERVQGTSSSNVSVPKS